jgi:hypothetical protein
MKWVLLLAVLSYCAKKEVDSSMSNTSENLIIGSVLTLSHRVGDIVNHKAFNGFGELLLPYDNNAAYGSTSLRDVATLMHLSRSCASGCCSLFRKSHDK